MKYRVETMSFKFVFESDSYAEAKAVKSQSLDYQIIIVFEGVGK